MSRDLALPRSGTYHLLDTMIDAGYVTHYPDQRSTVWGSRPTSSLAVTCVRSPFSVLLADHWRTLPTAVGTAPICRSSMGARSCTSSRSARGAGTAYHRCRGQASRTHDGLGPRHAGRAATGAGAGAVPECKGPAWQCAVRPADTDRAATSAERRTKRWCRQRRGGGHSGPGIPGPRRPTDHGAAHGGAVPHRGRRAEAGHAATGRTRPGHRERPRRRYPVCRGTRGRRALVGPGRDGEVGDQYCSDPRRRGVAAFPSRSPSSRPASPDCPRSTAAGGSEPSAPAVRDDGSAEAGLPGDDVSEVSTVCRSRSPHPDAESAS